MLLQFQNQIREEANEFVKQVLDMVYSSPKEATIWVERQLLVLGGEDDYAKETYLIALNKAEIHQKLSDRLTPPERTQTMDSTKEEPRMQQEETTRAIK